MQSAKRRGKGLSQVDELILREYQVNGFDGKAAYKLYHPKAKLTTSQVKFSMLLHSAPAEEFLQKIYDNILRKYHATTEKTIEEWTKIAYAPVDGKVSIDQKASALKVLSQIQKLIGPGSEESNIPGEPGGTIYQFVLPDNGFTPANHRKG